MLTAMNSTGTVILAAVVLKERLAPSQIVGLVLALASIALVASGVLAGLLGVGVFVYKRLFANLLPVGNFRGRR